MLMIYPLTDWLILKLVFVVLLYGYFYSLHRIFKQQARGNFRWSGQQLRAWNEVPTVLLFAIVFLVVLKNTVDFWWGLAGLAVLVILLMTAIKIYKGLRKKTT
jgi:putative membrane protein